MKSISVKPKKRGRPATGKDPLVGVRMPEVLLEKIDVWVALQDDDLTRSEAIRRLLEEALNNRRR